MNLVDVRNSLKYLETELAIILLLVDKNTGDVDVNRSALDLIENINKITEFENEYKDYLKILDKKYSKHFVDTFTMYFAISHLRKGMEIVESLLGDKVNDDLNIKKDFPNFGSLN